MHYFVYLLRSEKDNNFYIGQTNNVLTRLTKHNRGEVRSTAKRTPFKFIGCIEFSSRKEALKFEKLIKLHSDQKIKFIKTFIPDFNWKSANNVPG